MRSIKVPGLAHPLPIEVIVWLEADGNYSQIHFLNGTKYLVCQTLLWFEKQLVAFIRVNKSGLVNPRHVTTFTQIRSREAWVVLRNGTQLTVARRRVGKVAEQLRMITQDGVN